MTAATFQYKPLPTTRSEIRLLRILAESKVEDGKDVIQAELIHVKNSDNIPYVALSYTWGDLNTKLHMRLNGKVFPITTNLDIALHRLQRFKYDTLPELYYWIDALCIDQSNVEEKSREVQHMGLIYSEAALVVAWLGLGIGSSGQVIHELDSLGQKGLELGYLGVEDFEA